MFDKVLVLFLLMLHHLRLERVDTLEWNWLFGIRVGLLWVRCGSRHAELEGASLRASLHNLAFLFSVVIVLIGSPSGINLTIFGFGALGGLHIDKFNLVILFLGLVKLGCRLQGCGFFLRIQLGKLVCFVRIELLLVLILLFNNFGLNFLGIYRMHLQFDFQLRRIIQISLPR